MKPSWLRIKARLQLLDAASGGRAVPFGDGYRPNHNFGDAENTSTFIGVVHLERDEVAYPGDVKEVWITFPNEMGLESLLYPGRTWRIQEGKRLIAYAEVLA